MVREKIESAKDAAENAVLDTTARAMVNGTMAVRKLSAKRYGRILMTAAEMAVLAGAMAVTAFAASGGEAEEVFDSIQETIVTWVGRIGVLVIVFGGINAGIGVANSDDAGRNRGLMTMAGGAVLIAVLEIVKNLS